MSGPLVVSYGGGVNSTAMLLGMQQRGVRPDLVLFADTGGEMPETYEAVDRFERWLKAWGWKFARVSNAHREHGHASLEDECLRNTTLPSLAFGFKGCSVKWKRQPMDRYVRDWQPAQDAWARGERVRRAIGIDADEAHRGKIPDDDRFTYHFPLIEWGWGRDECLEVIRAACLPVPPKSACFFCPARKKSEILELAREHPRLAERAFAMERNAAPNLGSVKGLGRNWSWRDFVHADASQSKLWPELDIPCMCFDGDAE